MFTTCFTILHCDKETYMNENGQGHGSSKGGWNEECHWVGGGVGEGGCVGCYTGDVVGTT